MKKVYLLAVISLLTGISFGAELFVRVLRPGVHVATAFNQTQFNNSNNYQFYSLPGGNINLQIIDQQTGYSLFNNYVNIGNNQRMIAELDNYGTLRVTQIVNIGGYNNGYGNNGTVVYPGQQNNGNTGGYCQPNNNYPHNGHGNNGYNNGYNNANNNQAFSQFIALMADESFDSNKLSFAKSYVNKTSLSAQQIVEVSRQFSFDSNRLEWAKYAYSKCYDQQNYFLLKSTFTFSSNYSALEDYIGGH